MTLDIKAWLGQLGLEEYAEAFFENGIEADLPAELTTYLNNSKLDEAAASNRAVQRQTLKIVLCSQTNGTSEPSEEI